MRSLPPPRITRRRRWKRIQRAIKALFVRGHISDPGAFVSPRKDSKSSVSIITKSRVFSRFRRTNITDGVGLIEGASAGIRTAGYVGKIATRASFPHLRPVNRTSKMNFSVRF